MTYSLHPYACLTCRLRKIKCNKLTTGCDTCRKLGILCRYAVRRTQQSRRARQVLTARPLISAESREDDAPTLIRQELVHEMRSLSTDCSTHSNDSPENHFNTPQATGSENNSISGDDEDSLVPQEMRNSSFQSRLDIQQPNEGRLLLANGKSRYITGEKAIQVASVERILSSISTISSAGPRGRDVTKSVSSPNESLSGSLFHQSSLLTPNLQSYHPARNIAVSMWEHYVNNVDILVKILHKPTTEALILDSYNALEEIDAPTEALIFGIYFAAVTTMSVEECEKIHKEERSVLIQRYGHALERALARARLLITQQLVVLQAMILLIICSSRKNTRYTWMLTGTALRIGQAMGMHRDSASFLLSPVEVEVRRRIWWSLCLIDHRTAEDAGLDCNVPMTMDTKLPLNVDDSDIDASNNEPLASRTCFTEMTVSLIKLEMAETTLKLKFSQPGKPPLSLEEREALVREQHHRYENSYLQYLDSSSLPIQHEIYIGTRMAIAKLWKLVYAPFLSNDSVLLNMGEIKDRLILHNTEILEFASQLPGTSSKFSWYFCPHTKLHAMMYLFSELCNGYEGPAADRAWVAMDAFFGISKDGNLNNHSSKQENDQSMLWKPLKKLLQQAHIARKQKLQEVHAEEDGTTSTHESSLANVVTPMNADSQFSQEMPSLDPFLGSVPNFSEEMNWEDMDNFLQKFRPDFVQQQDFMDYQQEILPLSWYY